jgi:hypothetical protein
MAEDYSAASVVGAILSRSVPLAMAVKKFGYVKRNLIPMTLIAGEKRG